MSKLKVSHLSISQAWFWYTSTHYLCSLFSYVSPFTRLLVETNVSLQNLKFYRTACSALVGFFFGCFFPLLTVILSCPFIFPSLPFVFAISFFPCGFFHCSFLLGALCTIPVHYLSFPKWVCISQHHQVNSHTFDQCFPPSFAHILHPKLRGKCEEIRQSREQHPETWSGKWLNNIPLNADNLSSVTKGCDVCSCFLYAHGFRSLHFLCLNGFNFWQIFQRIVCKHVHVWGRKLPSYLVTFLFFLFHWFPMNI